MNRKERYKKMLEDVLENKFTFAMKCLKKELISVRELLEIGDTTNGLNKLREIIDNM